MERRFHRGFTAAEKTELWDRWKRGESLKAIGMLERTEERFGLKPQRLAADTAYGAAPMLN